MRHLIFGSDSSGHELKALTGTFFICHRFLPAFDLSSDRKDLTNGKNANRRQNKHIKKPNGVSLWEVRFLW